MSIFRASEMRYYPDLRKDDFIPLAVVVSKKTADGPRVAYACVRDPKVRADDLIIDAIMRNWFTYVGETVTAALSEAETRGADVLEALRVKSRLSIRASAPEDLSIRDDPDVDLHRIAKARFDATVGKHPHFAGSAGEPLLATMR